MTLLADKGPQARADFAEPLWPSPRAVMLRRARRHVGLIAGGSWLLLMILVAVFAPLIAPFDPYDQELGRRLIDPVWLESGSWVHPFGTDALGRDYLSRVVHGARVSLTIGLGASLISCLIGVSLGIIGGYFGGRADSVVMYIVNVKLSLPGVLMALALVALLGSSTVVLTCILGFLFWERYAVVTRSVTQQLRNADFVMAARACGASHLRILARELLPNIANPIVVVATLEMAIIILVEAALSFLGLGTQPPTPSWGLMVSEGRNFMFFKPYLITIPGVAIFLLVMAINLMGDGIRDVTAPESRN